MSSAKKWRTSCLNVLSSVNGIKGMTTVLSIMDGVRCSAMEAFSALLAFCAGNSPVPGEFPTQSPVTRSFDFSFDLHLNKRSSKQS